MNTLCRIAHRSLHVGIAFSWDGCGPRVHFKLIIYDLTTAYIGSANFTGAGLGAKGAKRRNFEAGVFTSDPALVQAAVEQFDTLWMGAPCRNCARKTYCADGAD